MTVILDHVKDDLGFCPVNDGPCGNCPHTRDDHIFHVAFCQLCNCGSWNCAICGGLGDL